jgi:hypothetical protein
MDCRVKPGNDGEDCGGTSVHLFDRPMTAATIALEGPATFNVKVISIRRRDHCGPAEPVEEPI